nr:MAG: hypothetical protein DIU56_12915 [Pseudomonadota bacterium]
MLTLALAARPLWESVALGSPRSVRRIVWTEEGEWLVQDRGGSRRSVRLDGSSAVFGPWLVLAWRDEEGRSVRVVVDGRYAEEVPFARLRGRLLVEAVRTLRRRSPLS